LRGNRRVLFARSPSRLSPSFACSPSSALIVAGAVAVLFGGLGDLFGNCRALLGAAAALFCVLTVDIGMLIVVRAVLLGERGDMFGNRRVLWGVFTGGRRPSPLVRRH
jgi:hypothetical protein